MLWVLATLTGGFALGADWPQVQHNAQRTGWTEEEVGPPYRLRWVWFGDVSATRREDFPSRSTDGLAANVQPIIVNDVVYVGSVLGRVYAIDARTGNNLWVQELGRPVMHTLAVADGVVIVPGMDRSVHGLDAKTGRKIWRLSADAGFSSGILVAGNQAVAGSRSGVLYAFDPASGAVRWQRDLGAPINNTPASAAGVVYLAAEDMNAYAIRLADGSVLWSTVLEGQSNRDYWPVVVNDLVIFRPMYAFNCGKNFDECERILDRHGGGWADEREGLLKYLNEDPSRQTMFVLDTATGKRRFIPPMGLVTTGNGPAYPPAVSPSGKLYTVWRARAGLWHGGTFWTKYQPQIDPMDLTTGDRIVNGLRPRGSQSIEIDNDFMFSGAGRFMFGKNSFRGTFFINVETGDIGGVLRDYSDGFPLAANALVLYGKPGSGVPGPRGGTGEAAVAASNGRLFLNTGVLICLQSEQRESQ